jgi:acyl-CoA synthetase (AMP-forming)/AMP-acid ligase II
MNEISFFNVSDQIRKTAVEDPQRIALVQARYLKPWMPKYKKYTYKELAERVDLMVKKLQKLGVKKGSLCSFMVPPCFNAMALGAALWELGAVVVGIEPHSHGLNRIKSCLSKVKPEFFFGTVSAHTGRLAYGWGNDSFKQKIIVTLDSNTALTPIGFKRAESQTTDSSFKVTLNDIAAIVFTTGSTGAPKPTVLLHKNISALVNLIRESWNMGDGSQVVDLVTFPIFWFIALSLQGTAVVPPMDFALQGPAHADPAALLGTIRDHNVRSMFASPALLNNLSQYGQTHGIKIPSVKRIVAGGAEVLGPLYRSVKAILSSDAELYSDYGATECMPLSEISGNEVLSETWDKTEKGMGLCAGKVFPGVKIKIIEIAESPIENIKDANELKKGQIGEIICYSEHFSHDYFNSPKDSKENKIKDNGFMWHRIGDTGYLDEFNRLWICGRKSHRVVTDQGTVFSLCVEPVFNSHPLIKSSALIKVKKSGKEIPAVCLVLKDQNISADLMPKDVRQEIINELKTFAQGFESTKNIDCFLFFDKFPVDRRHNAKIDRPKLAQLVANKIASTP